MLYSRQSNIRKWMKRMPVFGSLSIAAVTACYSSLAQETSASAVGLGSIGTNPVMVGGLVAGIGMLLGAVIFALRRRARKPKTAPRQDGIVVAPKATVAATPHAGNGTAKPQLGGSNGSSLSRPAAAPVLGQKDQTRPTGVKLSLKRPLAAGANGKNHRKRSFDYNRYFADLLDSVSGRTYISEFPGLPNGASPEAGLDGDFGTPTGEPNRVNAVQAHAEMIANQKSVIEEQRRLIAEQTKLIEEKSRLISEKNELLKMQSEFMEHKLL